MKLSFLSILSAIAALAITQSAQATSPDYILTTSSGASIVPGTSDIGLHGDDNTQSISLPFPVAFYDQVFNSVTVSTNGNLQFSSSSTDPNGCINGNDGNNVIAPAWSDLTTQDGVGGQGIFTSVSGAAPNRIFNIEWRAQNCCGNGIPDVNFEARLYEGQRRIDFIYGNMADGHHQIGIGVQRDTGSQYTAVSCNDTVPDPGTQYTFTIPDACTPPPPNMVAWWRGDGNADDSVGGHHGSLIGGATFAPSKVDQGFSFAGTGDYVSVPSPVGNFGTGDFTIDFWMQTTSSGDIREIINKRLCGVGSHHAFEVRMQPGGNLQVQLVRDEDPTGSFLDSVATVNDGQFHHIAITRDGDTLSLYIDGALDTSITNANVSATNIVNEFPLGIGGGGCAGPAGGPDGTQTFEGILDEVELFGRALSTQEIDDIFIAGSAGKCKCTPPPDNMISWWPGEGDGNDIQGGNNLTAGNGNGFGFDVGEVGSAFSFDGTQFATAGTPANLVITGDHVTIDGWIKPNTSSPDGHYFGRAVSSGNDYAVLFTNGTLNGVIKTANGEVFVTPGFTPPAGIWTHVALSYDGATARLYVNGTEIDSEPQTGNISDSGAPFNIGGRADDFDFNGQIDEVEVFDQTLSAQEIASIYHAGSAGKCRPCVPAPDDLVGWWPGEGDGKDIEGSNNATLNNITFAAGEVGQAFLFNGSSSDINVPATSTLNVGAGDGMTIDMWINPDAAAITNTVSPILAEWNAGSGGDSAVGTGLILDRDSGNNLSAGALEFELIDTLGNGCAMGTGPGAIVAGQWQHVAATYDKTTGQTVLYVNGQIAAASTCGSLTLQTSFPLDFGIRRGGSGGARYTGAMDEIEVFSRALSQSEIQTIYDAGSGGKCKPSIPIMRQFANISSRASVGTDDNVTIGGFIIQSDPTNPNRNHTNGTGVPTKRVIIRGLGPSLQVNGTPVADRLADPVLELHDNSTLLATNDNWGDAPNASDIQASGFAPGDPNESAILVTLNSNTAYTAILRGAGNASGIGLIEIFDLTKNGATHLANISTRAFVDTGDDVLIGGLIIQGDQPSRVIVHAIGPSLTGFGVANALQDPALGLYDTNGALVASNDDWGNSPDAAAISATGFAPSNPKESAVLFVPAPGNYTAIVSGNGPNPTGIGLVEAFRLRN